MGKKFIIFDFDGTLVHTNDVIIGSWQATYEHYLGRQVSRSQIEQTFGETLADTIRNRIPDAPVEEVKSYYRAWQEAHKESLVYIYDGIKELLAELRGRGCVIGVGTSRTASSLWNYLRQFGIDDSIDAVVTMDDVTRHKPDPESLNVCLAKLSGFPADALPEDVKREAIMIGDTKFDIGCSNNAGIDSVLVGWSHYVDEEDMAEHGFAPTYRIDRPEELLELI